MAGDSYNNPWPNSEHGQAGQLPLSQSPGQNDAPTEFYNNATMAGPALGDPATPAGQSPMPPDAPDSNMTQAQHAPQGYPYANRGATPTYQTGTGRRNPFWPKDPAYRILYIAIGVILLCSLIGVIMLVSAFSPGSQGPNQADNGTTTTQTSNTPTPASTAQHNQQKTPTVVSTTSSAPTPTPTPTTAPTPSPTSAINNGPLTVQITSIPSTVNNNSTVPIVVTTNKPGATVRLVIFYVGGQPVSAQLGPQSVDANGNTTFYWNISEKSFKFFGSQQITAHVSASAQDQNNNTANSPTATVQIRTN